MAPHRCNSHRHSLLTHAQVTVAEARSLIEEAEAERWLSSELVTREALRSAEQDGIVFIDEIDKIVDSSSRFMSGGHVSSEVGHTAGRAGCVSGRLRFINR